jgi:tRNA threonylcarbamoyladenosine biosynthesis protein TsaE
LASTIRIPAVICLYGDLGSGKTTFVQGFARGLGISERITSPSFLLMKQYHIPSGGTLYHIDLYKSILLEIEEIVHAIDSIVVIEWADKIKETLPKKRIDISFTRNEDDSHTITYDYALH